jgi:hypothetical protein
MTASSSGQATPFEIKWGSTSSVIVGEEHPFGKDVWLYIMTNAIKK